jgi:hypothetical protein
MVVVSIESNGNPQADYDAGTRLVKETGAIDQRKKPIVWYNIYILLCIYSYIYTPIYILRTPTIL